MLLTHSRPSSPTAPEVKKLRLVSLTRITTMKRPQGESYHEPSQTFGWELVKHSWCTEFHAQWWGCGEERLKGPGTVIDIKQEELWPHLGCLSSSSGQILLREEHELLYERMCFSAERRDPEHRAGAIITGQHGIGTSFCFTS